MQLIQSITKVEDKAELNVFGKSLYLATPEFSEVSGDDEGSRIKKFADRKYVPCTVICYDDKDGHHHIITSISQVAELFEIGRCNCIIDKETSDAMASFENHINAVLNQLHLNAVYLRDGMVITSSMMDAIIEQRPDATLESLKEEFKGNRDFAIASSNMGAATVLSEMVKAATSIYDNLHCYSKVSTIIDILKSMTTVDDYGNAQGVSITQLENIFDNIKSRLFIK